MSGRIAYYGNIVKDGLVFDFDAAKKDCYPQTGTICKDLIELSNTGSLINGPIFNTSNNGSIFFDGTNDYIDFGNLTKCNFGTNSFTVCSWARTATGADGYIISKKANGYTNVSAGFGIFKDSLGSRIRITLADGGFVTVPFIGTAAVGTNLWTYYVVLFNRVANTCTLYTNTVASAAQSISNVSGSIDNSTSIIIGSGPDVWAAYDGYISTIQMYNRLLSTEEISQNYNATKKRYGL